MSTSSCCICCITALHYVFFLFFFHFTDLPTIQKGWIMIPGNPNSFHDKMYGSESALDGPFQMQPGASFGTRTCEKTKEKGKKRKDINTMHALCRLELAVNQSGTGIAFFSFPSRYCLEVSLRLVHARPPEAEQQCSTLQMIKSGTFGLTGQFWVKKTCFSRGDRWIDSRPYVSTECYRHRTELFISLGQSAGCLNRATYIFMWWYIYIYISIYQ